MTARELLSMLKAQVETVSQIEDSSTAVTEIKGSEDISKITVTCNIEGREKKLEVYARVVEACA